MEHNKIKILISSEKTNINRFCVFWSSNTFYRWILIRGKVITLFSFNQIVRFYKSEVFFCSFLDNSYASQDAQWDKTVDIVATQLVQPIVWGDPLLREWTFGKITNTQTNSDFDEKLGLSDDQCVIVGSTQTPSNQEFPIPIVATFPGQPNHHLHTKSNDLETDEKNKSVQVLN